MKCKVCGNESGKYPLCRLCNTKKEQGDIIKCIICGQWHYAEADCPIQTEKSDSTYLYEPQKALLTSIEQSFFTAIKSSLPEGYQTFPQINLAAFIDRTDDAKYRNELFRNVDFLITDSEYAPKIAVEINDQSHLTNNRRERDKKVQSILEEAGIPMLKLWTSYGVNTEYIKEKITELLNSPVVRKHNFDIVSADTQEERQLQPKAKKKQGCYIATCVYGSYDCPQVWTLRRFRDFTLAKSFFGRAFISLYYAVSPRLVKCFGNTSLFKNFWRKKLDSMIEKLNSKGVENTPYNDKDF